MKMRAPAFATHTCFLEGSRHATNAFAAFIPAPLTLVASSPEPWCRVIDGDVDRIISIPGQLVLVPRS
jgi:hypothetical protein